MDTSPTTLGNPELIISWAIGLVLLSAYVVTLSGALKQCSPEVRAIQPGLLWLLLIPFFNLFWHFFVVIKIADSLNREQLQRKITNVRRYPGRGTGLATCILVLASVALLALSNLVAARSGDSAEEVGQKVMNILGPSLTLFFAGFVCWIVYWAKISRCSRRLNIESTTSGSASTAKQANVGQ